MAAGIAAAAVLFLAVAAQASTPVPVRATPANEMHPAAGYNWRKGIEFVTWSQSRHGARGTFDAYLQRRGGPVVKLNKRGHAWAGDVDVAQRLAVYQQVRGDDSRIMLYNWVTKQRTAAPKAVNTAAWEFAPRIQGDYLLFGRQTWQTSPDTYEVLLYNRADGTLKTLDMIPHGYTFGATIPGQVNGDWVVWAKATDNWATQRVYRYNLATGVTDEVPVATGRIDYAPSVTPDGTVYFVRSGAGCGDNVRILRFTGEAGTSTARVYALPAGRQIDSTYAEEQPSGPPQLLFSRLGCDSGNWNIYRLLIDDAAPQATVTSHSAPAGSPMPFAPWANQQLHH
ncbi:MAG TPA: hypothetical protein VLB81_04430 [Gaiellales bacterium]|nr:hypothetical protein [Gaiellales bacterium]